MKSICLLVIVAFLGIIWVLFLDLYQHSESHPQVTSSVMTPKARERLSNNDCFVQFTEIHGDGTKHPFYFRETTIVQSVEVVKDLTCTNEEKSPRVGATRITYNQGRGRRIVIVTDSCEDVVRKLREG